MTHTVNWVHCKRSGTGSKSVPISCPKCDPKMMHHNQHDQGTSGITSHGFWINFRFDANSTRLVSRRFQTLSTWHVHTFSEDTEPWNCRKSRFPIELTHNFRSRSRFLIPWAKWTNFWMDVSQQSIKHVHNKNFPYPISMISNLIV